jgi:hypothetical protein
LHAVNLPCADWENKLQKQVSKANHCELKLKACIDKQYGNPRRELNYCRHIDKTSLALDAKASNISLT